LAKYLSPGYLRIGGNAADVVTFQEHGTKGTNFQENFSDFNEGCLAWDLSENCSTLNTFPQIIMTGGL